MIRPTLWNLPNWILAIERRRTDLGAFQIIIPPGIEGDGTEWSSMKDDEEVQTSTPKV